MSAVNVTNVTVLDNPSMFLNPFHFEISYECLVALKDGNGLFLLPSGFFCELQYWLGFCRAFLKSDFGGSVLILGFVSELSFWR